VQRQTAAFHAEGHFRNPVRSRLRCASTSSPERRCPSPYKGLLQATEPGASAGQKAGRVGPTSNFAWPCGLGLLPPLTPASHYVRYRGQVRSSGAGRGGEVRGGTLGAIGTSCWRQRDAGWKKKREEQRAGSGGAAGCGGVRSCASGCGGHLVEDGAIGRAREGEEAAGAHHGWRAARGSSIHSPSTPAARTRSPA
jgi:hypothetical protein